MGKEIMVCNSCEQPLIWTFAFPYAEWFCMNEYNWGGMLGFGHRVEATPELKAQLTLFRRRWGQIRKHLVMGRFKRRDCIKCEKSSEDHNDHLTDEEIRKSEWAVNKLKQYAGVNDLPTESLEPPQSELKAQS